MVSEAILYIGLGAALAVGLSSAGTALAAPSAAHFSMQHHGHEHFMVAWAPMVISGVLSLYGLIVGVILAFAAVNSNSETSISQERGYRSLAAGLTVGLACLASGAGMGAFLHRFRTQDYHNASTGEQPARAEQQPLISNTTTNNNNSNSKKEIIPATPFLMNLVFMEAIGLYGLIIALFLSSGKS
ncbi:hypothetical protein ACA910_013896 [Epithemia clementina (nom. ined.)]